MMLQVYSIKRKVILEILYVQNILLYTCDVVIYHIVIGRKFHVVYIPPGRFRLFIKFRKL